MTPDPHEPFRRPRPLGVHDDASRDPSVSPAGPAHPVEDAAPVILDAEFHQSVWKPWQEPDQSAPEDASPSERAFAPSPRRISGTWLVGVTVVVVAFVAAFLLPPLLEPPVWRAQSFVADMETRPGIAWSTEGRQRCWDAPDDDHAILWDITSVRSLDLRDGSTRWEKKLTGARGYLTCAPAADVVAISEVDESGDVLRIKLLRSSTGAELAELSGDSTTQVVALGLHLRLLDRTNVLKAVDPARSDAPLWTHLLPGPRDDIDSIHARPISPDTTELSYSLASESAGGTSGVYRVILSTGSGATPVWARGSATDQEHYERVGEVVIRSTSVDGSDRVEVLDLHGRELWSRNGERVIAAGQRLYLMSGSQRFGGEYSMLRQIDPRTGRPLNDKVFEELFDYATEVSNRHIAILQGNAMRILDENLAPQPALSALGYGDVFPGHEFLYVCDNIYEGSDAPQLRLSAVDPSGAAVLWSMELEPGQHVEQWGQHLVVISNDGLTIQGLGNT